MLILIHMFFTLFVIKLLIQGVQFRMIGFYVICNKGIIFFKFQSYSFIIEKIWLF